MIGNEVLIEKLEFDIHIKSKLTSKQIMRDVDGFVHHYVLPILEKLLLQYQFDEVVRLENVNLEIDIENMLLNQNEAFLTEQKLIERLKSRLDEILIADAIKQGNDHRTNIKSEEILLEYLTTGRLPWYCPSDFDINVYLHNLLEFKENKPQNRKQLQSIKQLLRNKPNTFLRLLFQFKNNQIIKLLNLGHDTNLSLFEQRIIILETDAVKRALTLALIFYRNWYFSENSTFFLKAILKHFGKPKIEILAFLSKLVTSLFPNISTSPLKPSIRYSDKEIVSLLKHGQVSSNKANLTSILKIKFENQYDAMSKADTKDIRQKIDNNVHYIQNAGLIIIHPFLENFFRKIEVLDQKKSVSKDKIDLAIHALHYISSGKEQPPEYQLVFEKYLCGIPQNYPVDRFFILEESIKEEISNLFNAILSNWKRLKFTSPEALRDLFFLREGKLEEDNHRLVVKRMAQDLLLENLPWSISVVKLPWFSKPIYVDW
ncbi:contractile injection system tape measure protein [Belliella kenyensis]|uniref:Contractile injection system tape measure protein n=1 Tax=Belliella kenyensis TaxID=1472724 RepID=A0ABV8EJK6_9BACT|nr:contractile injection system tape measure protein [Belliella kenyensis]MCH7400363.1 contractile injection system tape measure protein [Belliella kenyensis]MDN3604619.1 contractile injection system tape measure protein [Belliella kenyensis]